MYRTAIKAERINQRANHSQELRDYLNDHNSNKFNWSDSEYRF